MLAEGAWVGVGLCAAHGFAVVGLGGCVDLRVFLPVAAVGEAPLTKLTLEWLLAWNTNIAFTITVESGPQNQNLQTQFNVSMILMPLTYNQI